MTPINDPTPIQKAIENAVTNGIGYTVNRERFTTKGLDLMIELTKIEVEVDPNRFEEVGDSRLSEDGRYRETIRSYSDGKRQIRYITRVHYGSTCTVEHVELDEADNGY